HRNRRGERPAGHQDQRQPRGAVKQRPAEVEAHDGVAEGDGEEGGKDDDVDRAVQGQSLVILDAEEALRANGAGARENLQQAGGDADDQQNRGEDDLEQNDLPESRFDLDLRVVHFSVSMYLMISCTSSLEMGITGMAGSNPLTIFASGFSIDSSRYS